MESIIESKDKLHFFEYLEVDILQEYLREGILYFVNAILNSSDRFVSMRYFSQEITTLIDFLKDFYYLYKRNSTYAEHFYDLQRKSQKSKLGALKAALIWTIIPYLCSKIDSYFNQIIGQELDGKALSKFKKIVKLVYPYAYALMGIIQTVFKMRYLLLQKDENTNLSYNIYYKIGKADLGHRKRLNSGSQYPIFELIKKPGLLILLMSHKIINWYFNQKGNREIKANQAANKQVVKPPIPEQKTNQSGQCPICTKKIHNPTVVRSSGYVYCYDCITEHTKLRKKCPMSNLPITEDSLQILFDN